MCIYLFTWMLLKLLLGQPTTYNVHPQENINLQFQGYVSKQNAKNFDDQNLNDQSLELLKEINFDPQQSFELIGNERLFSFQLNENEDIEIILLRDKSIECLFEVKNYLQDYEINMKKVECSILLNHTDCFQLHKLDSQNFIVQCNEQNNTIISVVNSQEVTDQIIIPIQSLCQSDSRLNNQTLIVFNKNCLTTTLYLVEIYNLGFNDFQEYNLTEIEGFLENSQEIVNVEFNNQKSLYLVYTNSIYAFYIKSKLISIIYEISGLQIKQIISYNNISIKYIIQENLETKQLYINQQELNVSSINYLKMIKFKKNLYVFQFRDKLLARFYNFSHILQIRSNNLIQIGQLPYFMAQSNQQFILIKLLSPQSVISYQNSETILFIQIGIFQLQTQVVHLRLNDPKNPKQIFHQNKSIYYLKTFDQQICLLQNNYRRNLPIKIKQIIDNGKTINIMNYQNTQTLEYVSRLLPLGKIFIIHKLNNDQLLLGQIQGDNVKLTFFQNNQPIKQHRFQLLPNPIKILYFQEQTFITIIYENQVEIYEITQDFMKKTIHYPETKIIKAIKSNSQIFFLHEDCTILQMINSYGSIYFVKNQYQFNCKSTFQFQHNQIYVDENSIFYKNTPNQKIILQEEVYEVRNVLQSFLLIFTQHDNQLNAKLFQLIEEIYLLYTLPTYNYTISQPLEYRIQKSILMIKARNQSQGFFLLIYDLQNTSIESLIQINEIDDEEKYPFDFINDNEYFFFFQQKLQIQSLIQPCFSLQITEESQDFIQNKALIITTQSLISNEEINLDFLLIKFNKNYTLQQLNINQNIITGNIFNFNNIYGNIDDAEIIGSEDISIHFPIAFTNYSVLCQTYRYGLCFNESTLIRNIFDQNTSQSYSFDRIFVVFYISFNQETCNHALYASLNESIELIELNFCQKNYIQKNSQIVFNNSLLIKNLKQINDIQIVLQVDDSFLFYYQHMPISNYILRKYHFYLLDGAKINNHTYLFFHYRLFNIELYILNITQNDTRPLIDIVFKHHYFINDLFDNLEFQFPEIDVYKIQIYHIQQINNKFQIDFILILQTHLSFLIKLVLDLNNLNNLKYDVFGMIRYKQNAIFEELLFIDENFVISSFQIDQNIFVNVFDISNISKNKNIDSIQNLQSNNYTFIERYNETHFVIIENIDKQWHLVHLITINKFKIECNNQCCKPSLLKLTNEVSQILIELNFLDEQVTKINFLNLIVIISSFICIVIKLSLKKKEIKIRRNNNLY